MNLLKILMLIFILSWLRLSYGKIELRTRPVPPSYVNLGSEENLDESTHLEIAEVSGLAQTLIDYGADLSKDSILRISNIEAQLALFEAGHNRVASNEARFEAKTTQVLVCAKLKIASFAKVTKGICVDTSQRPSWINPVGGGLTYGVAGSILIGVYHGTSYGDRSYLGGYVGVDINPSGFRSFLSFLDMAAKATFLSAMVRPEVGVYTRYRPGEGIDDLSFDILGFAGLQLGPMFDFSAEGFSIEAW